LLILFGKHRHPSRLDPKPDVTCLGIIDPTFGNRRTNRVFMAGCGEEPSLSNVDRHRAMSGINGSLCGKESTRRNQ
jgi:hypothetical protein